MFFFVCVHNFDQKHDIYYVLLVLLKSFAQPWEISDSKFYTFGTLEGVIYYIKFPILLFSWLFQKNYEM